MEAFLKVLIWRHHSLLNIVTEYSSKMDHSDPLQNDFYLPICSIFIALLANYESYMRQKLIYILKYRALWWRPSFSSLSHHFGHHDGKKGGTKNIISA